MDFMSDTHSLMAKPVHTRQFNSTISRVLYSVMPPTEFQDSSLIYENHSPIYGHFILNKQHPLPKQPNNKNHKQMKPPRIRRPTIKPRLHIKHIQNSFIGPHIRDLTKLIKPKYLLNKLPPLQKIPDPPTKKKHAPLDKIE